MSSTILLQYLFLESFYLLESPCKAFQAFRILHLKPIENLVKSYWSQIMAKRKLHAKNWQNQIIAKAQGIFDELNQEYFKGKLKPLAIILTETDDFKAAIYYKPSCRIVLSLPFARAATEYEFNQVILHEMIHYFFYFFNIKDSSSILTGHSPQYKRVARRLGMNIYN